MIDPKSVSLRIDLLRRRNSLSQEQMAEILEVSQPAISKYLRDRIPPAELLYKLAQWGQTTVEWILTGRKSYVYGERVPEVRETGKTYDADWDLLQKIAGLDTDVKEAVVLLIEKLSAKQRELK